MQRRPGYIPLNVPQRIEVQSTLDGTPLRVRRAGRSWQRVEQVLDQWRIVDEWWRQEIRRHYWRLALESGAMLDVYEDATEGGWYEQRWGG